MADERGSVRMGACVAVEDDTAAAAANDANDAGDDDDDGAAVIMWPAGDARAGTHLECFVAALLVLAVLLLFVPPTSPARRRLRSVDRLVRLPLPREDDSAGRRRCFFLAATATVAAAL